MEDAAHCTLDGLIVGVDRFGVAWPMSWTKRSGGSQQGLDRFVSENDQRGHRSETDGKGLVAACAADALNDVFAA